MAEKGGFGVFGYYTDNNEYDPQSIPNFMYNQLVTWNSSNYWEYAPIKYWPNEYGNNASSDDQDKVSFFAYAPYVEVNPNTGKVTDTDNNKGGIVALSRNSASGDPLVKYVASFNAAEIVDLCWGVNAETSSWALTQGGSQTLTTGLPWLNVERPYDAKAQNVAVQQRVKFTFHHALAKLNVKIDVDPDVAVHDATTGLDAATKVYVRSVSFSGIAMKGSLNLNNSIANTAEWLDYNGTGDLESGEVVTVYDGRKDGKEGTLNATASNETQTGLSAQLIQTENGTETGVTHELQNLFTSGSVYVIPTGETVEVEIVYDVETEDSNLGTYLSDGKTPGSSIENRIKKTITFGGTTGGFKSGQAYTLNLHLGMNSVKFDAEVATDWDAVADPNDAWLPANVPQYMAGTDAEYDLVLPATTTSYTFGITGLGASETLTTTPDNTVVTSATKTTDGASTDDKSNAAGSALTVAAITANTTTVKTTTGNVKVAGATKSVKLNITQEAAPLGLSIDATNTSGTTITLAKTATNGWDAQSTDDTPVAASVAVKKGTTPLNKVDASPSSDQFSFSTSDGKITLNSAPSSGDTFEITVKTGDAPAETVTFTVE